MWPEKHGTGSLCYVGRWNEDAAAYRWEAGQPVWLSREDAFNGLLEADVNELKDGRVLIVWRVTKNGRDKPAYKWYALSGDGGFTFSEPRVFSYSDGTRFFRTAPSTVFFEVERTVSCTGSGISFPGIPPIRGIPVIP